MFTNHYTAFITSILFFFVSISFGQENAVCDDGSIEKKYIIK